MARSKRKVQARASNGREGLDPVTKAAVRPAGAGMYLHWEGRKGYRTRMPAPRVLEPVPDRHRAGLGLPAEVRHVTPSAQELAAVYPDLREETRTANVSGVAIRRHELAEVGWPGGKAA